MIEEIIPKSVRTWTVFKNTNNTLEGVEAIAFAMWQAALDEADKESDNIVLMSIETFELIQKQLQRLKQENEELKKIIYGDSDTVQPKAVVVDEVYEKAIISAEIYKQENEVLTNALKVIKEILNTKCSITANAEVVGIINEVLNE